MTSATQDIEVDIDKSELYKYMGYENGSKPRGRVVSLIDEYTENAPSLIQPSYSYTVKDIELVHGSLVVVEDMAVLQSKTLAGLLEHCEKVAVFIAIIDDYLENMSKRLVKNGLMLQASCLDAIGSVAVQSVADSVRDRIERVASREYLVLSRRLSPGWCDWDTEQQRAIFQAVDGGSIGVRLTDGCLMIPQKSVSGIIGLGTPDSGADTYNPCKKCDKTDCPERIV